MPSHARTWQRLRARSPTLPRYDESSRSSSASADAAPSPSAASSKPFLATRLYSGVSSDLLGVLPLEGLQHCAREGHSSVFTASSAGLAHAREARMGRRMS